MVVYANLLPEFATDEIYIYFETVYKLYRNEKST